MNSIRTDYLNPEFQELVSQLNEDLANRDGKDHPLAQFNEIMHLKHVVVVYIENEAVGCGAIAKIDFSAMEIKRMYVTPAYRGQQIGENILTELENWAKELNYKKCILETGKRQVAAVKFYAKCKYQVIENYGQYQGMQNSICFEKQL